MMLNKKLIALAITLATVSVLSGCAKDQTKNKDGVIQDEVSVHSVSDTELASEMSSILGEDGFTGSMNDIPLEEKSDVLANDTVYFAYNSSEITQEMRDVINKHSSFLRTHSKIKVILEGHTDERGSNAYNVVLGEKRAQSVKDVLLADGIPDTQVEIISYGELRPLSIGGNEEAWKKDRRAVFTYQ